MNTSTRRTAENIGTGEPGRLSPEQVKRLQLLTRASQRVDDALYNLLGNNFAPSETSVPVTDKPVSASTGADVVVAAEQIAEEAAIVNENITRGSSQANDVVAAAEELTRRAYASQDKSVGTQGDYTLGA